MEVMRLKRFVNLIGLKNFLEGIRIELQNVRELLSDIQLLMCSHCRVRKIRRPLLARGTKAACLGTIAFLTISGHAFQLSGYAFISLEGPNRW